MLDVNPVLVVGGCRREGPAAADGRAGGAGEPWCEHQPVCGLLEEA